MELHMTFLPKAFRTQELVGLLAAIPAAALGSAFFDQCGRGAEGGLVGKSRRGVGADLGGSGGDLP
jgi:hypothetical protein